MTRLVSAALLLVAAASPAVRLRQQQQPPPKPTPTAEHKQFDFWVGEWDVLVKGRPAGVNVITSVENGFAIRENWTSAGGGTGTSLNFFDRADGKWHQVWIDAGGNALFLAGGLEDGKMVMRSGEVAGAIQRITWTPLPGGLRQLWETSRDGGATWTPAFDGQYKKRER